MAFRLLRACNAITSSFKGCQRITEGSKGLLLPRISTLNVHRELNFFSEKSAEHLWKGVTSVSNPGRKRGRARGLARKKDLHKGQILGIGKINMQFPGLNAPVYRGREIVMQQRLPPDESRFRKLLEIRQQQTRKKIKVHPLERGWTSVSFGGKKFGAPEPVPGEVLNDFQSWILEAKMVCKMTGNMGRKRRSSVFVVVGNQNGLAGFCLANGAEIRLAATKARNRAAHKLMLIERFEDRTVLHDFFAQYGKTKVYVKQMPKGYGLVCHRVLKACCEAIGISDIYVKMEGSRNPKNLVKAFFAGLLQQKSYQQLADEKKLHVVRISNDNSNFPTVIASPDVVRTRGELKRDEILDYKLYLFDGKVKLERRKREPFYTRLPGWSKYLKKQERLRHQYMNRVRLEVEYGHVRSFLTDKYPEADPRYRKEKAVDADL